MVRHFLSILDLSREDIHQILNRADVLKNRDKEILPLEAKNIGMIFEKLSTRTRVSFEAGINDLGGRCIYLNPRDMQLGRGETIPDTARVLSSYLDGIIIRTYGQERMTEFSENSSVPVINALTDAEHPTQILSDLYTIMHSGVDIERFRMAYLGDGNNIANSFILAASILGFELAVATPPGFEPDSELVSRIIRSGSSIEITNDPVKAATGADVIYTDVWISMGQEREKEEIIETFEPFQVNRKLLEYASDKCLVMHCLPAHRGMEISEEVISSSNSVVFQQAENKLHCGRSVLEFFFGNEER